jgi:hypothetical protein
MVREGVSTSADSCYPIAAPQTPLIAINVTRTHSLCKLCVELLTSIEAVLTCAFVIVLGRRTRKQGRFFSFVWTVTGYMETVFHR